jgi:hypothetical protein
LTLELERGADPPCGRVLTAAAGELRFAGWLGFALALEQAIEGAAESRQVERGGSS